MKQKLLLVMFTLMTCLLSLRSAAQTRYQDSVFASYTLTTVTYSSVYGYQMDIYQPTGDTVKCRPTVVLAHEGTFISGNRSSDPTVVGLCQSLSKKGYVVVSIDYTLVPLQSAGNLENADSAALEVFRAVSDGKAAVRYLKEYAYTYGVDTGNIFVGGNSAGAVLAMQYVYIDSLAQLNVNPDFPSLVAQIGGLEGNSGNPGYSSNVKGCISLAGGLNQVSWMGFQSKPIVMAQGTLDSVVPYTCGFPQVGIPVPLQLCGLGSCAPNIVANTTYYDTLTFPGLGHVPWDANAALFYQVDTLVTGFLYYEYTNTPKAPCVEQPNGIQNISATADISLYPNPAGNVLNIRSSGFISGIAIIDEMGRVVSQASDIHSLSYQVNTSGLSRGVYFVNVQMAEGHTSTFRKVVIE
jgi:dienelactone hydrolase